MRLDVRTFALTTAAIAAIGCSPDLTQAPDGTAAAQSTAAAEAGHIGLFGLGGGSGAFGTGRGCRGEEYRQFDFWLGRWEIDDNQNPGQPGAGGTNVITSELDGCALFEHYVDPTGSGGRSLNAYDAADRRWHQHWVDQNGRLPLLLDGGIENGSMVMRYARPSSQGTVYERITWTPVAPAGVRQVWDESLDEFQTILGVVFDGTYRRAPSVVQAPSDGSRLCLDDPAFAHTRRLDFTVGEWDVRVGDRGATARSSVTLDQAGCLVEERLTATGGYEARVFSSVRFRDRLWQRTYVDNRGVRVFLSGIPAPEGPVVLAGSAPDGRGGTVRVRATFEPAGTGFVQRWERSADGTAWVPLLEAAYTPRRP